VVDPGAEIPLTFPPAVIIPRTTPEGSDAILQAIFNIRVGHQWEGHLKKYMLNKDGSIGELQWDAGELLNTNKPAANRNIFTVGDGLSVFGNNNFNISNFEKLKPILYGDNHTNIDNEDAKKLINFVRGVDVFDEFSGQSERWKLGDTYHADLLVVGPPNARMTDNPDKANTDASYRYDRGYLNFALANKNRKSVVFAAANDGMLHAFDLKTGEELWAFIPPMIVPRLQLMQSATANQSTSIYGVDGSPVYKDVYLQGQWRTVVMGGLGMGGHGYYALDVTDIETPLHLFSFAYDPATQQGSIWQGQNGQKTSTSDFNKLGEAWSKPSILRIPNYGWVAVFGGGFNNEISEYGSMVYIVDIENKGRLVKAINVHDNNNKLTNTVPAAMTAITPDSSDKANYTGAMIYFADLEGKLWKLDLTDQGSMFAMEQIFDAEASHPNKMPPGNGRLTYFPVAPSIGSDGKLRLFYGTGDMQDLMDNNQNIDNRFYGVENSNFSNPASQGIGNKFTESSLIDTTNNTDICTDENDNGWKIKLEPTEKVNSKANVSYGTVTFSRYTPLTTESCRLGKTSITGVDYQCGSEEFNIDLGIGITTVPTLYKGKLYIGISGDAINTFTPPEGWTKKDNLLMGEPGDLSTWQGVETKSWRERF
jgi:type IV pilus assembly protein PilY1